MQGKIFSTFVLVFALAVMALSPSQAGAVVLDRIVAVVGDESITWVDLRLRMEDEFAQQLKGIDDEERAKALEEAESDFLQTLIVRKLQLQKARRLKIDATDRDIDAAIADIRGKYDIGPDEFRETIGREGLQWDRYRRMIGDQITMQRVVDRMVRSKVPEPRKMEGASALYKVRLVLFATDPGDGFGPVQHKVDAFLEDLRAGASFEELEPKYSDGPAGTLEIRESDLSEELKAVLSGLRSEQISSPFMTGRGVMVVKLYERVEPEELERERLFQERYRRWVKELTENAYIDIRL